MLLLAAMQAAFVTMSSRCCTCQPQQQQQQQQQQSWWQAVCKPFAVCLHVQQNTVSKWFAYEAMTRPAEAAVIVPQQLNMTTTLTPRFAPAAPCRTN
jgi:hypothetical protein